MDAQKICATVMLEDDAEKVSAAIDVADNIFEQSIEMAQHVIGHGDASRRDVLALATAHAQSATIAYAAHQIVAVLRELTPEISGAISEARADIGAGILGCIQQALTPTHENHNHA